MLTISDVTKWKDSKGKKELLKHLRGQSLTWKEAVLAKCADCTCGYDDSKADCKIPDCPLYGHMPYRTVKTEKLKTERTEKQVKVTLKLAVLRPVRTKKAGRSICGE
ncbi:MAG: hypothetical protein C0392_16080 [Syntrophus sp. (in: bacteria)]|nr:hypothetical protein [Syntrophus sp. (in: bacteria)]